MRRQSAFTLIEIIVTLVVISIAATALIGVFANTVRGSADPVIQQQATTIAEAYLEEIMLRAFNDPQDPELGLGWVEAGEPGRAEFDDVQDYSTLAAGATADQFGNPVAALAAYTVTVTITNAALGGLPAADSLRVDVDVAHPAIGNILLSGFRTRYP